MENRQWWACRAARSLCEQFAENVDCWTRKSADSTCHGCGRGQETEERIEQYAKRLERIQMESKDGAGKQKDVVFQTEENSCSVNTAAAHLEAGRQDHTVRNFRE